MGSREGEGLEAGSEEEGARNPCEEGRGGADLWTSSDVVTDEKNAQRR